MFSLLVVPMAIFGYPVKIQNLKCTANIGLRKFGQGCGVEF